MEQFKLQSLRLVEKPALGVEVRVEKLFSVRNCWLAQRDVGNNFKFCDDKPYCNSVFIRRATVPALQVKMIRLLVGP